MLVATHQVEEIQHVLTDVLFIDRGRIVFERSMDDIESRFQEVFVHPDKLAAARALNPIAERQGVGHSVLLFEGADRQKLAGMGDMRTPSLADLFLAVMSGRTAQGARS